MEQLFASDSIKNTIDFCCGLEPPRSPAAEAVGPTGKVVGVPLPTALELARVKAIQQRLANIQFEVVICSP